MPEENINQEFRLKKNIDEIRIKLKKFNFN